MASTSRKPSGKRPRQSSGASLPVSAVSLVPPARVDIFNKDIGKRSVVQQHAFYKLEAQRMHLPEVLSLLQHQGFINFLECNTKYSEDLVRVFYAGLHETFRGHKLSSRVGSTKVSIKSNFWNGVSTEVSGIWKVLQSTYQHWLILTETQASATILATVTYANSHSYAYYIFLVVFACFFFFALPVCATVVLLCIPVI